MNAKSRRNLEAASVGGLFHFNYRRSFLAGSGPASGFISRLEMSSLQIVLKMRLL